MPGPFLLLDDEAWRFCCEFNIVGTASTFKYAALAMRAHGGSLVAISTAASSAPEVSMAAYTSTKAAVDMMVRAAAWELGAFGIRVNAIQPGYVPTEGTEGAFTDELSADLLERSALKRSGTPDDIGALVVHLAQPAGAWITGQVIGVDGGMGVQPMADLTDLSRRIYGDAAVDAALGLAAELIAVNSIIDVDRVIDELRAETGLNDFGDPTYRDGLDVLVAALTDEAHLNDVGHAVAVGQIHVDVEDPPAGGAVVVRSPGTGRGAHRGTDLHRRLVALRDDGAQPPPRA